MLIRIIPALSITGINPPSLLPRSREIRYVKIKIYIPSISPPSISLPLIFLATKIDVIAVERYNDSTPHRSILDVGSCVL